MASFARIGRSFLRPVVANKCAFAPPILRASASTWNKDWKPGPYPKTPEERAAAAKKYGLRPEDYEPYPDDGCGYGDYPKLPPTSAESRDPYEDWDMPSLKRNYGEPMHVDADYMSEDKFNPNMKWRYGWGTMCGTLVGILGSIAIVYYLTLPYPHFLPALPKQYPQDGPHYTFEKVD